jgi:hypothetical protein
LWVGDALPAGRDKNDVSVARHKRASNVYPLTLGARDQRRRQALALRAPGAAERGGRQQERHREAANPIKTRRVS